MLTRLPVVRTVTLAPFSLLRPLPIPPAWLTSSPASTTIGPPSATSAASDTTDSSLRASPVTASVICGRPSTTSIWRPDMVSLLSLTARNVPLRNSFFATFTDTAGLPLSPLAASTP
ncbi:Uncharacterised protein [Bordetella pertussis]|nr:Uncharacterised protein [Bordetella pertussis]